MIFCRIYISHNNCLILIIRVFIKTLHILLIKIRIQLMETSHTAQYYNSYNYPNSFNETKQTQGVPLHVKINYSNPSQFQKSQEHTEENKNQDYFPQNIFWKDQQQTTFQRDNIYQHENTKMDKNNETLFKEILQRNQLIISLHKKLEQVIKANQQLSAYVKELKLQLLESKQNSININHDQKEDIYQIKSKNRELQSQNLQLQNKMKKIQKQLQQEKQIVTYLQNQVQKKNQQKDNAIKQKNYLFDDLRIKNVQIQKLTNEVRQMTKQKQELLGKYANQQNDLGKNRDYISTNELEAQTKITQLEDIVKQMGNSLEQKSRKCDRLGKMIQKIQQIILKDIIYNKQQLIKGAAITNSGRIYLEQPIYNPYQNLLSLFQETQKMIENNQKRLTFLEMLVENYCSEFQYFIVNLNNAKLIKIDEISMQNMRIDFKKNERLRDIFKFIFDQLMKNIQKIQKDANDQSFENKQTDTIKELKNKVYEAEEKYRIIEEILKIEETKKKKQSEQRVKLIRQNKQLQKELQKALQQINQTNFNHNLHQYNIGQKEELYQNLQQNYQNEIEKQKNMARQLLQQKDQQIRRVKSSLEIQSRNLKIQIQSIKRQLQLKQQQKQKCVTQLNSQKAKNRQLQQRLFGN